jgi:phage repressor protein C with HTH and peptisase S24 domain
MRHDDIWRALDALAAENGLSASGLARKAGLDPTAFNPSKRVGADGRARWPSTESIAKVLDATGTGVEAFADLITGKRALPSGRAPARRHLPLIGVAQASGDGYFDEGGLPTGSGWDEIAMPEIADPHAYALEIAGDAMEPVLRDGDTIIVSPAAPVRRGDRVVVRTTRSEVLVKELIRQSARRIELKSLNPLHPNDSFDLGEIAWTHRVVWLSQ